MTEESDEQQTGKDRVESFAKSLDTLVDDQHRRLFALATLSRYLRRCWVSLDEDDELYEKGIVPVGEIALIYSLLTALRNTFAQISAQTEELEKDAEVILYHEGLEVHRVSIWTNIPNA